MAAQANTGVHAALLRPSGQATRHLGPYQVHFKISLRVIASDSVILKLLNHYNFLLYVLCWVQSTFVINHGAKQFCASSNSQVQITIVVISGCNIDHISRSHNILCSSGALMGLLNLDLIDCFVWLFNWFLSGWCLEQVQVLKGCQLMRKQKLGYSPKNCAISLST